MNGSSTSLQLSSGVYDRVKQIVQVLLPGVGSLYLALATIWGLPNADKVTGTCSAVALFLGLILTLSSKSYNSDTNTVVGEINVSTTPEGSKLYSLDMGDEPDKILTGKSEVRFKINEQ